jgi:hypothetical protein
LERAGPLSRSLDAQAKEIKRGQREQREDNNPNASLSQATAVLEPQRSKGAGNAARDRNRQCESNDG